VPIGDLLAIDRCVKTRGYNVGMQPSTAGAAEDLQQILSGIRAAVVVAAGTIPARSCRRFEQPHNAVLRIVDAAVEA
jgi:hypothetical protein